jgi:hypothetical protein
MPENIQDLIKFLKTNEFRAECPQCNVKMNLSPRHLFYAENFKPEAKELPKQNKDFNKEHKLELKDLAQKKSQKIETTSQNVNIGFILERSARFLVSAPVAVSFSV